MYPLSMYYIDFDFLYLNNNDSEDLGEKVNCSL